MNTAVFVVLGLIIGGAGIGWYITLVIYLVEIVMHILCEKQIRKKAD